MQSLVAAGSAARGIVTLSFQTLPLHSCHLRMSASGPLLPFLSHAAHRMLCTTAGTFIPLDHLRLPTPFPMQVVLLAMGGYGALYQGWQIRLSDNADIVAKAKEMHPKLAFGMFFFFALGASGGMMSLLMQVRASRRAAVCMAVHSIHSAFANGLLFLTRPITPDFGPLGPCPLPNLVPLTTLGAPHLAWFLAHTGQAHL